MSHVHVIRTTRPEATEYAPYYGGYIGHVPTGDVVETLATQAEGSLAFLRTIGEEVSLGRYAPGKWSIREVVGHIIDAERIFTYRALRFARNDETALSSFDENAYIGNASFDDRSLASLCDEFEAVRRASVLLFASLNATEWMRRGIASNNAMSVRALAWVTAGHELHHVALVKSRYL
ncbi:MAG: DinB family protein [Gemmatimonadaceae bacterium]|nr:DinB family protein [Gemmatimonadaceae bacterium]